MASNVIYFEFRNNGKMSDVEVNDLEIGEHWIKYYSKAGNLCVVNVHDIRFFRINKES